MSDSDFLNRLYLIKPFKMVESPEANKHNSEEIIHQNQHASDPFNEEEEKLQTPTKEEHADQPLIQTQLFSNLTTSIDNLFSKIEKIKSEFEPQLSNSNKKKCNGSGAKRILMDKENNSQCLPFQLHSPTLPPKKKIMSEPENLFKPHFKLQSPSEMMSKIQQPRPLFTSFPATYFPERKLTMRDFELGKCVGSGKFGDVHICRHRQTGTIYALKKIFKSTLKEYKMIDQFIKELKIHYKLNHPNIVKLYTHFQDDYHLFLLMEYAEGGQLMNHLKRDEQFVSRSVEQVIDAVQYLHKNQIAHRDIKPENIVITADVIVPFMQDNMKLCDFGWSSMFENEMKKTFCGTLDYISPEMKDIGEYTVSVDLWSIGVLTFELLVGYPPYKKQIDKWKQKGSKMSQKWKWDLKFPQEISDLAQDFINGLLKENPNARVSLRECKSHDFIKKYKEKDENKLEFL